MKPVCDKMTSLSRYTYCCNSGINDIGITNYFMSRFEANSTRENLSMVLLTGSKTYGRIDYRPREEPNIIMLNVYNNQLSSNLYT